MKLIHCADLHLDSRMNTNLSKEKAKERKMEILHTFTRMVDYANEQGVKVILIAGDLFDTSRISATARNTVVESIRMHSQIDFLYLKGNHDMNNFLSELEELPENLKLFGEVWTGYRYGSVVITGLELTADNRMSAYPSLVLEKDDYNIVTLHGQDSPYGGKKQAEMIHLDALKNKNIDYLALGHIHSYREEKLDARGVYCYPGCMEGRGFDECGEKGFVLLDIDEESRTCSRRFCKIAERTLYTLEVDVSNCMTSIQAGEKVQEALLEKEYPASSLVKVVLKGAVDVEAEISEDYILRQISERFYYEKVKDETTGRVCYQDYAKEESLKGEFIRLVQDASDMEEEEKAEVIRYGLAALLGEEL